MDRKKLLETLSVVRPAVATTSLIQVFTHLWFTGRDVLAYNEQIGISAPCDAGFVGAVPGATLLSLLSAATSKEVEFTSTDSEVTAKAGGARMKLPLLPKDSFRFEMPAKSSGDELPVNSEVFIDAIRGCLRSVSQDTSVPDQLGVTLIPRKKSIDMYSLNGASMSRARVALKAECPLKRRVVLSSPFCEQLVRLAAGDKQARLVVAKDYSLLVTSSGARVFGKLIQVPKPLDFEKQFAEVVPADLEEQAVDIPTTLVSAIERALVVADPTGERVYSSLQVADDYAVLETKSVRGEVRDRVKVAGHPGVSVSVDAQWLKVGAPEFDKVLVTKNAVIMSRPRELYLVATTR